MAFGKPDNGELKQNLVSLFGSIFLVIYTICYCNKISMLNAQTDTIDVAIAGKHLKQRIYLTALLNFSSFTR